MNKKKHTMNIQLILQKVKIIKKNIIKFVLNFSQVYLIGGLTSLFLLIYLVITDPYFKELDFKLENFKMKIDKYLLFTFDIPLFILVLFCIIIFIKTKSKNDKLIIGISSLFGIIGFIVVDNAIKKQIIYPNNILLGLLAGFFCYILLFFIINKEIRKKYNNI